MIKVIGMKISEKNKGIVFILMAAACFSFMSVCIHMSGDLPTIEKVLFRNLVAMFVSIGMLIKSKEKIRFEKGNLRDLIMRAVCGTVGMVCNFYAIDKLNISDANLLNKLSPFFAILMSGVILREKAHKSEWMAVFIAFVGALLVIKPGMSMSTGPALVGLLGGFGAGVAYTFVRRLGKNGVKGTVIVMFFSSFSTLITLPGFIMYYKPMSGYQLFWLLMAGVAATGGQLCITAAYTYAPAKEISVYDYTQVIFAAVWGFIFFAQIPDILSLIGYVIILVAAIIRYRRRKCLD